MNKRTIGTMLTGVVLAASALHVVTSSASEVPSGTYGPATPVYFRSLQLVNLTPYDLCVYQGQTTYKNVTSVKYTCFNKVAN